MKYNYDKQTDILSIIFSNDKLDHAEEKDDVITYYNKQGRLVEIEILDAHQSTFKMFQNIFANKRSALADSK